MRKSILILAGDTDGNLGDLAIVTATCDELRRLNPEVRIALPSSCAERDRQWLGVVPLRRGWRGLGALLRRAREADLVICGGGGLFQDDDSLLKMPYWALRLALLRLLARRIAGLSIGAGPLDHPVSRLFGRLALRSLFPVSARDSLAVATLQPLTASEVELVPDPAFMLAPAARIDAQKVLVDAGIPDGKVLVGVCLRRCFHVRSNLLPHKYASKIGLYRDRGKPEMAVLTSMLSAVLMDLVTHKNAHIIFMPTYNVSHENDAAVCDAVANTLPSGSHTRLRIRDPKLYKGITGLLSVMLCGRMHPAILAAGQGTPVVGLAYNQKFFGMFSLIGQEERCLSVSQLVTGRQSERLASLLREAIDHPGQFSPDTSALARSTAAFLEGLVPAAGTTAARRNTASPGYS